jgi:hypothetical protein
VETVTDLSEAHPASIFRINVHPNQFNPEDGGSKYLQNVDNTDHIQKAESTPTMKCDEARNSVTIIRKM